MATTLSLHAVGLRGRKAYKDDTGTIHLECTKCGSIKPHYDFVNQKHGFLSKRADCYQCQYKNNKKYKEYQKEYQKQYRIKMKKAKAKYS